MERSLAPNTAAKGTPVVVTQAPQRDLLRALQAVAGIVDRRGSMPILGNVLLTKNGTSLGFTTSDLEHQMDLGTELGAGEGALRITVGARKLLDMLKSLPDDATATLALHGHRMMLTAGKARFTVQTLPAEDFPLVTEPASEVRVNVRQKELRSLIEQVAYSMAVNDVRYFLNGMLLAIDGNVMRSVATDGHRLALAEIQMDDGAETPTNVILPRKAVLELQRLLKDTGDEIAEISLSKNQAAFRFSGLRFITRLVEGRFPDYRRVIPPSAATSLTIDRAMLLACLQRVDLLANEKFRAVSLSFRAGTLELSVTNENQESAREEISIDYAGDKMSIGFNVAYLITALTNIDCETVVLGLNDVGSSMLLTHPDKPAFRCVVMPMRL